MRQCLTSTIVVFALTTPSLAVDTELYWMVSRYGSSPDEVRRANLGGAEIEILQQLGGGGRQVRGITVDPRNNCYYWTDRGRNTISRAVGTDPPEILVDEGLAEPEAIKLDLGQNKMYWTDAATNKIQRANLDGTDVEDLVTEGLDVPRGLALDVAENAMYWVDRDTPHLMRADLDGSNVQVVASGTHCAWGMTMDPDSGLLYIADCDGIKRASTDGSLFELIVPQGGTKTSIDVDPKNGYLYWGHLTEHKLFRAALDGGEAETVITERIGSLLGLAVLPEPSTLALLALGGLLANRRRR